MKRPGAVTVSLLGLTTFQVAVWWLMDDRQFLQATAVIWLFLLAVVGAYHLILQSKRFSARVMRFHLWLHAQITGRRIAALSCVFMAVYVVWYAQHAWEEPQTLRDYGSFLYRQTLLHDIFPRLLAYNPMLNGGYLTYETLMTGSINLFLVTYPIGALFSPETAFKAQPLLLILLLPGAIYLTCRLLAFTHAESLLSAVFALVMTTTGHGGFVQLLRNGTLPFLLSCELAVVVFALSYRVFVLGSDTAWTIPLIILLGSLAALHPLFIIIMGPVALAIVLAGKVPWKRRALYCAIIGAGVLALNAGWVSELSSYDLGSDVARRLEKRSLSAAQWWVKLENTFFGLQAPLVVAALAGVRALLRAPRGTAERRLGGLVLFAIVYYAFLGATGYYWMSHTVFPIRFAVPLAFYLALALGPAWPALQALWTRIDHSKSQSSFTLNAALGTLGLFTCLPYCLYFLMFPVAPQKNHQLMTWLKANGDDGRVFVYGPDMKDLGQLSLYQIQSSRPLMGYFHGQVSGYSLPWLQNVGECLQDPARFSDCQNIYNIRYVISLAGPTTGIDSHGPRQGVPYPKNGGLPGFGLVKTIENIEIYENRRHSNYFLMGSGRVKQHSDRITVTAEPADFVVLKFFWFPGLRTEPPLVVEPYRIANGQAFIKIRTLHQQRFEVFYR